MKLLANHQMQITAGHSKTKMPGLAPNSFPAAPATGAATVRLSPRGLKTLIRQSPFALATSGDRYLFTIKLGEREHFGQYFESFFPDAFEQMGAIALGQFYERSNPAGFTRMRGFYTIYDRPTVNAAFYYGPLWREIQNC